MKLFLLEKFKIIFSGSKIKKAKRFVLLNIVVF